MTPPSMAEMGGAIGAAVMAGVMTPDEGVSKLLAIFEEVKGSPVEVEVLEQWAQFFESFGAATRRLIEARNKRAHLTVVQ